VRGCLEWQKVGLRPPETVRAATKSYREAEDAVGRFIADCCELADDAKILATPLYESYTYWCKDNGEKYPLTQRRFGARLTERGLSNERRESKTGRTLWTGIRLRQMPTRNTEGLWSSEAGKGTRRLKVRDHSAPSTRTIGLNHPTIRTSFETFPGGRLA
jgi:phage/plasmid-associated DNA primase